MNQQLKNKIEATDTSINKLLKEQKFTIDYFQLMKLVLRKHQLMKMVWRIHYQHMMVKRLAYQMGLLHTALIKIVIWG